MRFALLEIHRSSWQTRPVKTVKVEKKSRFHGECSLTTQITYAISVPPESVDVSISSHLFKRDNCCFALAVELEAPTNEKVELHIQT